MAHSITTGIMRCACGICHWIVFIARVRPLPRWPGLCFTLHASCFMLHASRFMTHASCHRCFMRHASCHRCFMLHASCFMLQTSSFMPQMLYVIVPSLDIFPLYTVMKLINSSAKGSNLTRLYYTILYYTYDISRRLGLSHGLTSHTRHLRTWLEIRERTLFRIPRI